jgi:hypothetical protein
MLTRTVPPEALMYAGQGDAIVDCADGYSAVRRDGEWGIERNRSHVELEADFYRLTPKAEILDMIRREWEAEYRENVRDGNIRKDRKEVYITGFIGWPPFFEEEIAWLEKFNGELSPADGAWIKNTRELITKYHVLYEESLSKRRN